ncbi:MAG: hypothetical protein K2H70_01995, partial [Bacteroidales bacterium]|nr:hypothetical protein [Bacteroidales bacterium]
MYKITATAPTAENPKTADPTMAADRSVGSAETTAVPQPAVYLFVEWGRSKLSRRQEEMPAAYSYAYYVDGALWSRRGHFLYDFDISGKTMPETRHGSASETTPTAADTVQATTATPSEKAASEAAGLPFFLRQDGYLHCVLKLSQAQLLILTAPALKPAALLYYHSFFLCVFFLAGLLLESLRHRTLFKARTYAQRLQYTVFGLVACAFAILGIVSFFFIREIDRDEHTDRLKEKSISALTALESRFMDFAPDEFPAAVDRFPDFLTELAHVLSADLYLFDRDGHFLLSNRLSAEQPQALCRRPFFQELQARNSHLQIREEHRLPDDSTARPRRRLYAANSLTAYAPFRNADNEILGYVMLPYDRFGRSWETVMHRYWGAYLNLFVWISLMTLLAAYLLSRYVTRPLKLLSRQMGALQLTEDRLSAPPPLTWRAQDEIG